MSEALDRHREQRDRALLAGREQHVVLAEVGAVPADLVGPGHELIGLAGHRRHHHGDAVSRLDGVDDTPGDPADVLEVRDARTPEFLDDQCHALFRFPFDFHVAGRLERLAPTHQRGARDGTQSYRV